MAKKVFIVLLGVIVVIYGLALLVPLDPEEQRPGTRLSGNLVEDPAVDWSFMQPRQKVWLQTRTWYGIPHSVTTVSFVVDGDLYIPCGWCATKRWPKNVAADPQVVVKVGDQLYPRRAVEVSDLPLVQQLFAQMDMDTDGVSVYRMDAP